MTNINLLPWREARREQEKKSFISLLLGALGLALVIVFLGSHFTSGMLDEQINRNQRLQDEINRLDAQIIEIKRLKGLRDSLISRMKVVHTLLSGRIITIHLFDELIKVLPDGVFLTEAKRTENKVLLHGFAESNSSVSQLMRNIQGNPWLHDPVLTEIKKSGDKKDVDNNEFDLSFDLKHSTVPVKT